MENMCSTRGETVLRFLRALEGVYGDLKGKENGGEEEEGQGQGDVRIRRGVEAYLVKGLGFTQREVQKIRQNFGLR